MPNEKLGFENYPERKDRAVKMETKTLEQIKVHANAIAELLYKETNPEQVKTLAGIEEAVRNHLLEYVNPEIAKFLSQQAVELKREENEQSKASSDV